ncbi:MAG: hypothetical protein J6M60_03280 [Clostridia bacterium]|nr:hypothetical protein [Clostridia bacterium]
MQVGLMGVQNTVLSQFLSNSENQFLTDLLSKITNIKAELNKLETDKEKIIKKIVSQNGSNNPKNKREYENSSETALESINIISKNLYDLLNNYNTISQLNSFIVKRCDESFSDYNFKEDIDKLTIKIKEAEELAEKIIEDNKKNYLIINSFLESENEREELPKEKFDINSIEEVTLETLKDNPVLRICERRVELPYTKKEVEDFMKEYPDDYKTPQDVISKEFITRMSIYKKHPILSRFKETYYMCRTKEMMSIFDSFNFAKNIMFRSDINAYIIAAVKSKKQLEDYIECLDKNKMDDFKYFKIIYEINPTVVV